MTRFSLNVSLFLLFPVLFDSFNLVISRRDSLQYSQPYHKILDKISLLSVFNSIKLNYNYGDNN
jgi:hypothetical protein